MTTQEFQILGEQWARDNAEYDGYIQELIDNPQREYTQTNITYLKKMQESLFEIETELLKIASGEETLES